MADSTTFSDAYRRAWNDALVTAMHAIQNHDGFTDDEKRIACTVIRELKKV